MYSVDGKKVTISATLQTPAEELLRIVAKDFQQDPIALDLAEVTSSGGKLPQTLIMCTVGYPVTSINIRTCV